MNAALVFTANKALIAAAVALGAVSFVFHFLLRSVRAAHRDPAAPRNSRVGLLSLAVGDDLRTSTSKVQVLLWTYAIALVVIATLMLGRSWGCDSTCATRFASTIAQRRSVPDLFTDGFQAEYLVLLGFPGLAAVIAKKITTSRASTKTQATAGRNVSAYLSDIVSDDTGRGDLGDFQYFVFNSIAIGYFIVAWLDQPNGGLPSIPTTLVALTGASASLYVAKKYVENSTPTITSADPQVVVEGQPLTLAVDALPATTEPARVAVLFDDRAVNGLLAAGAVTVQVPPDLLGRQETSRRSNVAVRGTNGLITNTVQVDVVVR